MEPADTVVDAGTTIVLNCQAEGEPTPTVEWSRQGRPLQGLDRLSTLSNGSLRISSAQKEDTAQYECVARNLLGSVLVRVTLTVRGERCVMKTTGGIEKIWTFLLKMWHLLFIHLTDWFAQFMEASQTGPTGLLAACPAAPGRRKDSDSATIHCLPMGGDTVQVRM